MGEVTYDLLKKLGMNAELAATDWATLTNRRASRERLSAEETERAFARAVHWLHFQGGLGG